MPVLSFWFDLIDTFCAASRGSIDNLWDPPPQQYIADGGGTIDYFLRFLLLALFQWRDTEIVFLVGGKQEKENQIECVNVKRYDHAMPCLNRLVRLLVRKLQECCIWRLQNISYSRKLSKLSWAELFKPGGAVNPLDWVELSVWILRHPTIHWVVYC